MDKPKTKLAQKQDQVGVKEGYSTPQGIQRSSILFGNSTQASSICNSEEEEE